MSSTLAASMALRVAGRSGLASRARKVSISPNTEAVSAKVSGVGAISAPLGSGEDLVHAVAEFVRERHHVARAALVVEQHIRMGGRHGRVRKGARRLAGPHRRVDPAAIEEAPGDIGHVAARSPIGVQHGVARLGPGDGALLDLGQRRVAVPMVERGHAEPLRLQRVIAVRQARIGLAHGARRARSRPPARRGWRGGGCRPRPRSRASGRRSPCPWRACW